MIEKFRGEIEEKEKILETKVILQSAFLLNKLKWKINTNNWRKAEKQESEWTQDKWKSYKGQREWVQWKLGKEGLMYVLYNLLAWKEKQWRWLKFEKMVQEKFLKNRINPHMKWFTLWKFIQNNEFWYIS